MMNSSHARLRQFVLPLLVGCVAGCHESKYHSPAIDVLGSYFPAWMISTLIGLALTLIFHLILFPLKLAGRLHPAPIVYACLALIFTLASWLVFFQN